MQTYLQFGYGMIAHSSELVKSGTAKGVILSPRDLKPAQLEKVSREIISAGGEVLFDPQCFARDSDHARLVSHEYWQIFKGSSTGQILGGTAASDILKRLLAIAIKIDSDKHILPGVLANPVSEAWFTFQERMIEVAIKLFQSSIGGQLFSTIALSNEVMMDEAQIEAVVERASKWKADGFYIVAQAPSYLVENPIWLGNLLILASGLKLLKKHVLVGYSNHQMLCLAASNVDSIASGTWLNVRSFDPDKFYIPEEDKKSQRAVWYYCPQALTEFKLTFLDVAQRIGILDGMKPNRASTYANPLFSGPAPSTINWGEQNAFRHYLSCLNAQVVVAKKKDFDTTAASHAEDLDKAERVLKRLKANGVLPQERDFADIFDVNRAALTLLINARGQRLRRDWV